MPDGEITGGPAKEVADEAVGEGARKKRRLFFALDPDESLRARLAGALLPMLTRAGGRPVPAERLHLTLVFLGELAPAAIPCVLAAAGRVRAAPFELILDHTGYWRRAGVMWLGARPCAALDALHDALRAELVSCAIPLEDRPYRPHVTFVRRLYRAPSLGAVEPLAWQVREYVLMESTGSGYRVLDRWELVRGTPGSRVLDPG